MRPRSSSLRLSRRVTGGDDAVSTSLTCPTNGIVPKLTHECKFTSYYILVLGAFAVEPVGVSMPAPGMEKGRDKGVQTMKFGICMFPTDYAMNPAEIGPLLEERDFESLWVAEHTHIPCSRKSPWPGGPELPKMYYDCFAPLPTLATSPLVFLPEELEP